MSLIARLPDISYGFLSRFYRPAFLLRRGRRGTTSRYSDRNCVFPPGGHSFLGGAQPPRKYQGAFAVGKAANGVQMTGSHHLEGQRALDSQLLARRSYSDDKFVLDVGFHCSVGQEQYVLGAELLWPPTSRAPDHEGTDEAKGGKTTARRTHESNGSPTCWRSLNLFDMSKPLGSTAFAQKSSSSLKLNQGGGDWADGKQDLASNRGDSDSDLSEAEIFIAKGAFLLTPSYELSIEKASSICEKMNFKSSFSLTKTATGILFKFENPEDYQAVFKKGFHKVTGARFYKKIPIPCRPQKTFTIFVYEIPDEIPEEDIRHALYKFHSVVELARLPHSNLDLSRAAAAAATVASRNDSGVASPKVEKTVSPGQNPFEASTTTVSPPSVVRITLASLEEANYLLENGLDFYGATFFPTDTLTPTAIGKEEAKKTNRFRRSVDYSFLGTTRVQDLLPVFDAAGFQKIPPPTMKTFKPPGTREKEFGKK